MISDPASSSAALDVLRRDLRIMDLTAITLCRENNLPIIVFNINVPGNLRRLLLGEDIGTLVSAARGAEGDAPRPVTEETK